MGKRIIDLDEEFLDLFNKEEVYAFFDFSLSLSEERATTGLCKISKPRSAGSKSYYISLLFMIDVSDDAECKDVDEYMEKIDWMALKAAVPGIATILPMPHLSPRSGIYFKIVDVYLTGNQLTRSFLDGFHPLFAKVAGFRAETPVYWDDMPQDIKPPAGKKGHPAPKSVAGYIDRLKALFGSS